MRVNTYAVDADHPSTAACLSHGTQCLVRAVQELLLEVLGDFQVTVPEWGTITANQRPFTLLTSNPFQRLSPAPAEGQDLNPILQDLGLAIHPPLLYVGYVGFSITYAFAMGLEITAWGRNIGDNRYLLNAFDSPAQPYSISGYTNQPRTWGGTVRYRF